MGVMMVMLMLVVLVGLARRGRGGGGRWRLEGQQHCDEGEEEEAKKGAGGEE